MYNVYIVYVYVQCTCVDKVPYHMLTMFESLVSPQRGRQPPRQLELPRPSPPPPKVPLWKKEKFVQNSRSHILITRLTFCQLIWCHSNIDWKYQYVDRLEGREPRALIALQHVDHFCLRTSSHVTTLDVSLLVSNRPKQDCSESVPVKVTRHLLTHHSLI